MGRKAAKLHGGGKSQPVLGFRMAFLFEFPHQTRVGQLSLPCTGGGGGGGVLGGLGGAGGAGATDRERG